jgi:hypothetical protein
MSLNPSPTRERETERIDEEENLKDEAMVMG